MVRQTVRFAGGLVVQSAEMQKGVLSNGRVLTNATHLLCRFASTNGDFE